MPELNRETLGEIMWTRKFGIHLALCIVFDFTVVAYFVKDLWSEFYRVHKWITNGLVMGNCLGFFASNITTIAWVLVDENSWLGQAVILIVASVLLTVCGAYFTVMHINYGSKFYQRTNNCDTQCASFSVWMPILAGINFLQGILAFMFFLLVCIRIEKPTGK